MESLGTRLEQGLKFKGEVSRSAVRMILTYFNNPWSWTCPPRRSAWEATRRNSPRIGSTATPISSRSKPQNDEWRVTTPIQKTVQKSAEIGMLFETALWAAQQAKVSQISIEAWKGRNYLIIQRCPNPPQLSDNPKMSKHVQKCPQECPKQISSWDSCWKR